MALLAPSASPLYLGGLWLPLGDVHRIRTTYTRAKVSNYRPVPRGTVAKDGLLRIVLALRGLGYNKVTKQPAHRGNAPHYHGVATKTEAPGTIRARASRARGRGNGRPRTKGPLPLLTPWDSTVWFHENIRLSIPKL